ncbi:coenzyme Q-binding protein COQ10 homolog B, mitochondrial-like [Tiliqua scincoides]|uniref:coenzyme Q-binding protein COQ10 homolog B, mitochondrial-like n=1 Tax=Tiliqua scincoides TaxID=71010 RepID=UPI003462091A
MAGSNSGRVLGVRALLASGLRPRCKKGAARMGLPHCRHLSSNRILASRVPKACPPLTSGSATKQQTRPFLNLAAPLLGAKRIEYAEAHHLPYSVEQMYDIVADVGSYRLFVPWCTSSTVLSCRNKFSQALLEVGFPPVVERYVSEISMVPHRQIRAVSKDGRLFQHLETLWQFGPGLSGRLDTCTLKFYVSFEFKSALHSRLANLFFDEVVKQMVTAFERRAEKLYGPQVAIRQHKAACCT